MKIQDSYKMVIAAEIRAQKMYAALAKSFAQPETQNLYTELVMLEQNHETKMRAAFARLFPGEILVLPEEKIGELKGIDLSDPQKVLEFAISREELAEGIYKSMAETCLDADLKQLLLQFAHEEDEHKSILLAEIQRLQGAHVWFDPSELNGLMED